MYFQLQKMYDIFNCVCVKRKTFCNCLCSSSSNSTGLIRNIGKFGAKSYFTDYRKANTIQPFVPIKEIFFGSILFQNKTYRRRMAQRLLDKYSHLFICISLKQTSSSGQKPLYIDKTLIEQITFAAALYFGQVFIFRRLINKSALE